MDENQLKIERAGYMIRLLLENEAHLYKSMRLEAIQKEPSLFRCSIPAEADLTDTEWQQRIKYPRAVFVLFDNDKPIGMTSILVTNEREAYLGQSYIRQEYRGKGLSSLLYEIRMNWAFKTHLKRLTVSHREINLISKAANQRLGFKYEYSKTDNWLDGSSGEVLYYGLDMP